MKLHNFVILSGMQNAFRTYRLQRLTDDKWYTLIFLTLISMSIWVLLPLIVRNKFRIKESFPLLVAKATLCFCIYHFQVKQHVDEALGYVKPQGRLADEFWKIHCE